MLKIAVVGAALGFLGAVGIYFEPQEPYPGYITLAGTLFGITTALLISTVVTRDSSRGTSRIASQTFERESQPTETMKPEPPSSG